MTDSMTQPELNPIVEFYCDHFDCACSLEVEMANTEIPEKFWMVGSSVAEAKKAIAENIDAEYQHLYKPFSVRTWHKIYSEEENGFLIGGHISHDLKNRLFYDNSEAVQNIYNELCGIAERRQDLPRG